MQELLEKLKVKVENFIIASQGDNDNTLSSGTETISLLERVQFETSKAINGDINKPVWAGFGHEFHYAPDKVFRRFYDLDLCFFSYLVKYSAGKDKILEAYLTFKTGIYNANELVLKIQSGMKDFSEAESNVDEVGGKIYPAILKRNVTLGANLIEAIQSIKVIKEEPSCQINSPGDIIHNFENLFVAMSEMLTYGQEQYEKDKEYTEHIRSRYYSRMIEIRDLISEIYNQM